MSSELHDHKPAHLIPKVKIALRGEALLGNARFNKGMGFPQNEREALGLNGRLPFRVNTLDDQCDRAYGQLLSREEPLQKNTFLQSLRDQNWTLYYALLSRHLRELTPIIYTPTEGDAIANYSRLFRRADGLFLTFADRDRMEEEFLAQTRGKEIDLIVCTDAEAILGIGDQGVGGIGISTAKSAMYTLIGGLNPARTLSVMLDVGTNNETLLNDPIYVGWPHRRVSGDEYYEFVDKFVQLVRKYFPHSLLHFEDFGVNNAYHLLQIYKDTHAAFNDDIQGTGAVTLSCVMAAIGISSRSSHLATSPEEAQGNRLYDQRYIIFGAGSAGMGVAVQIRDAMISADGVSREEANLKFWLIDREGLLYNQTEEDVQHEHAWTGARAEFVRPFDEGWSGIAGNSLNGQVSLLETVKRVKPTVLIGCSTAPGTFTEEVVKAMNAGLKNGEKPIIFPLSNPSRLVEAKPVDILTWTNGRALVATGSPFGTVKLNVDGEEKSFKIAECNNALIYPGLGFGAILSKSRRMTDTMLIAGAKRLASLSPAIQAAASPNTTASGETVSEKPHPEYVYNGEALLPDFGVAPKINFEVGIAVAQQALLEGTASPEWLEATGSELTDAVVEEVVRQAQEKLWVPVYSEYEYDPEGATE